MLFEQRLTPEESPSSLSLRAFNGGGKQTVARLEKH